jgi:hypothetical protein
MYCVPGTAMDLARFGHWTKDHSGYYRDVPVLAVRATGRLVVVSYSLCHYR